MIRSHWIAVQLVLFSLLSPSVSGQPVTGSANRPADASVIEGVDRLIRQQQALLGILDQQIVEFTAQADDGGVLGETARRSRNGLIAQRSELAGRLTELQRMRKALGEKQ